MSRDQKSKCKIVYHVVFNFKVCKINTLTKTLTTLTKTWENTFALSNFNVTLPDYCSDKSKTLFANICAKTKSLRVVLSFSVAFQT